MKQDAPHRDSYMDAILAEAARQAAASFREKQGVWRDGMIVGQEEMDPEEVQRRYAHFHGSRQTGKTQAGVNWAFDAAKEPGSRVCMMTTAGERYLRNAGRYPEAIEDGG
jgi:hypothetical protein